MGAQKAGTTALTYFLMQHPEIYMPEKKEMHFFDDEEFFAWSGDSVDYTHYHKDFHAPPGVRLIGEATPIYMYWLPAAERIREYNQSIKMIFLLRNPIDRAYSHYILQQEIMGNEPLPFSAAIRMERKRRPKRDPRQSRIYSYIDRGYYARQIKRLLDYFPLSQMLFIKTEQLRNLHAATLDLIFTFLGVSPVDSIEPATINSNQYPPMSIPDRKYLLKKFRSDIEELEKLLDRDCSDWLADAQQRDNS